MRIAIIGNSSDTLIMFRLSLMKLLSQKHEVYAVCPSFTWDETELLKQWGIKAYPLPINRFGLNPFNEFKTIVRLIQFYLEEKIDVSFCYFIKPVIYGTVAAYLTGVRRRIALIEGLGYFFTEGEINFKKRILRAVIRLLFKISLPRAHKVIFLNPDDRNEVEEILAPLDSYILGGIGVDLNIFFHSPPTVDKNINFLMVARVLKEKGVIEYLTAAKNVASKFPQANFWLAGGLDNNPGAINEEELRSYLTMPQLKWWGAVSNIPEVIRASHVFVLPSYREGVPRSTQEAMAVGRAVITTNVSGCKETVTHGLNGFLVSPKSTEELEQAFEAYLNNHDLIIKHGLNSRKIAEIKFDALRKDEILLTLIEGNL